MHLHIKTLEVHDLCWIADQEVANFGSGALSLTAIRQYYDLFKDLCFLGRYETAPVGYILAGMGLNNCGWLLAMGVNPEFRRHGVGRALIETAIAAFIAEGAQEVFLTVSPDNGGARELYFDAGFENVERISDYFGKNEDRYLMRLKF